MTSAAGEALALVSRAWGVPAARLAAWREAFRAAGQDALHTPPLDSRDRASGRLRAKLGEATMGMALLVGAQCAAGAPPLTAQEGENGRARPPRPPRARRMAWRGSVVAGERTLPRGLAAARAPHAVGRSASPWVLGRRTRAWRTAGVSWQRRPAQARGPGRDGHGGGIVGAAPHHAGSYA